jgi:hypothetical protein
MQEESDWPPPMVNRLQRLPVLHRLQHQETCSPKEAEKEALSGGMVACGTSAGDDWRRTSNACGPEAHWM